MLIVISPAKTLDYETPLSVLKGIRSTQPRLLDKSEQLADIMRDKTPADLAKLMGVSDRIAHLNVDRFAQWQCPFPKDQARPAIFAFKGDVYTGLDISRFSTDAIKLAQQRLRILSGLYGVLRPLDQMLPYRLEMGTTLANPAGKDLYAFWDDRITQLLKKDLKAADTNVLVNLASQEYYRSVKEPLLDAQIITPVFEDEKNGKYKIISFNAKKARGMMAAWIIRSNIRKPEQLRKFAEAGYRHAPDVSTTERPVFRRPETH